MNKVYDFFTSTSGFKKFDVVDQELGEAIIEADYDAIKTEIGIDLRPSFHQTVSQYDRFKFLLEADGSVISECVIDGIILTFNKFAQEHYIHAFDEFGDDFIKFARQFYPLDIYEKAEDEVTLTIVKPITDENPNLDFWIWNNAGHKYPLKFKTFEEYILCGIDNKFVVGWQYFYVETESVDFDEPLRLAPDFSDAMYRMDWALQLMKKYFPDDDWSMQEQELKRVNDTTTR